MAVFLQPIYTQTVGAGGAATITFNNIPQTFTDLCIKASLRSTYNGFADGYLYFNGNGGTTQYSSTILYGDGSGVGSYRYSNNGQAAPYPLGGSNLTANTFANIELYIPNYAGSNFKSFTADDGTETNATTTRTALTANLWQNTSAITSMTFSTAVGFAQYSTFSLYGILRQGV